MKQDLVERRQFLKKLGLGAAGISAAAVMAGGLSQVKQGGAVAKEELDKLSEKYARLDKRSKLMMRGMFVLLGIDVLLFI
ncbi:MAG: hypothetical protein HOK18_09445 [Porticoccaceae bacterium]|jgi:hypothetical protein|nr:hypothetical protein [Porticoccaceae bacterium]MBT6423170.1 hypothetical protein [Porticoccaceae bacterium]